ncbi:phage scaffolding protein [Marinilactibacillus sp. GCM10026970]|uniref:phage scaffolding protein n=1 Tax=Marinilactibacillus sp. GCM10026970 TaxID=3252642 RepID=UPI00360B8E75
MEWIKTIIKKHTDENGKVDLEAANKEIDAEFPKNAVPKEDFNSKVEELKSANDTLSVLKKDNKDVEKLQTQITDYEKEVERLQAEQADTNKQHAVESALRDAGAKDVDYLRFKLGEVELNKDGTVKDLDNKIKGLKESTPDHFESTTDPANDDNKLGAPGYKAVDNKLDGGKQKTAYSFDQLDKLTPQEINDNWDAVQAALEQGGNE